MDVEKRQMFGGATHGLWAMLAVLALVGTGPAPRWPRSKRFPRRRTTGASSFCTAATISVPSARCSASCVERSRRSIAVDRFDLLSRDAGGDLLPRGTKCRSARAVQLRLRDVLAVSPMAAAREFRHRSTNQYQHRAATAPLGTAGSAVCDVRIAHQAEDQPRNARQPTSGHGRRRDPSAAVLGD